MGKCSYCGRDAGLLRSIHEECKRRHEEAQKEIAELVPLALADDKRVSTLLASAQTLSESGYVSPIERAAALRRGLDAAIEAALEDHLLSHAEEAKLTTILDALGITEAALNEPGLRERLVKPLVLRDISEGHIPQRFGISSNSPLNLQHDEVLVWAFVNVPYYELRTRRSFEGTSHGVSVRIAKGVYYRFGQFKGHPVETSGVELADTGLLAATTKRIYFVGPIKSVRIPYTKIVSITPYSDGIGIQRDAVTAKPQTFITGDGWFTYNLVVSLSAFTPGNPASSGEQDGSSESVQQTSPQVRGVQHM